MCSSWHTHKASCVHLCDREETKLLVDKRREKIIIPLLTLNEFIHYTEPEQNQERRPAVKIHCQNRYREDESLVLTSSSALSVVIDRMLVAVVTFGCLGFLSVLWMHMTASAHLVAVQTLQALASLGTLASVVWTLFRGNANSVVKPTAASAKTFKCLFVMLAGGMLIGGLNPGVSDILTFLCSIPGSLTLKQNCPNLIAEHEDVPTSEEYLIRHMSK